MKRTRKTRKNPEEEKLRLRFIKLRKRLGWTQVHVADAFGCTPASISTKECAVRAVSRKDILAINNLIDLCAKHKKRLKAKAQPPL